MKYIILLFFTAFLCLQLNAQKVGHINYGNLLENLPQVKVADKALTSYQDSLSATFESRVKAHEQRITDNQNRFKAGEMTKVEAASLNKSLNEEQIKLAEDQKKLEASIQLRRQQMLQPIIQRINAVIAAYGKEKGFMFIFDESAGLMLYDKTDEDLTQIISDIVKE